MMCKCLMLAKLMDMSSPLPDHVHSFQHTLDRRQKRTIAGSLDSNLLS